MHNQHDNLDTALDELLMGASLASVQEKYPALSAELAAHTALMQGLHTFSEPTPPERGLRAILTETPRTTSGTPSPYLSFFTIYRAALVLPVLLLVFIGAGFALYPRVTVAPTSPTSGTPSANEQTSTFVGERAGSVPPSAKRAAPASFGAQDTASPGAEGGVRSFMLMTAPAPEVSTSTATSTATTTP